MLVFLSIPLFSSDIMVLSARDVIQPVVAGYIVKNLQQVDPSTTSLVIIELDTPGGLGTSMKEITGAVMNCAVPVCVYVSPSSASATSAGFFILMSADIAAMAPSTSTGAAHPVNLAGSNEKDSIMLEKAAQHYAASIRTMAENHGRNVDLAEKAVLEAVSFTEQEAYDHKLIELIASNRNDLIGQLEGYTVKNSDGSEIVLTLEHSPVQEVSMSFISRFLSIVVHPNIALLLLSLGGLGLFIEFTHPGVIFPGVAGTICLLLGLYGISVLPINYAGLALIILGIVMFILEIKVVSYGMLTIGGLAAFIMGGVMLHDSPIPGFRISISFLVLIALILAAAIIFLGSIVLKAHRVKPSTGVSGLTGERGRVVNAISPGSPGRIFVHGEYWNAVSLDDIPAGIAVIITSVEGMTVTVRTLPDNGG